MVKIFVVLPRREGVSSEEFGYYLLERHPTLVAALPGPRRLVVNRVLPDLDALRPRLTRTPRVGSTIHRRCERLWLR